MKILFLSYKFYPDFGGIESISEMLASNFSESGHEVCLVTSSPGIDNQKNRFPFKILRNPGLKDLFLAYRWADMVFENNPTLHLSWPNLGFRKPYVVSLQTWIVQANGKITWREKLKFFHLKYASCVVACSEAIRVGCWPEALVIGNPYNQKTFKLLPEVSRNLDFVFLGRLVSDKGADIAIKAFSKLVVDEPKKNNHSLTVIGDGPELNALKTLALELGLENNINFAGKLFGEKLTACLNQHRCIIVPSIWEEPFGIVVLEGMACGCIPIVSNTGGLPDAAGNAGLLFIRGDSNDLTNVMKNLMENDGLQGQLLENAQSQLNAHGSFYISSKYLDRAQAAVNSKKAKI